MTDDSSADEARREVIELVETAGVRAAAQAAIEVCRDDKAPPAARATAAGLLFRVAAIGGYGKGGERESQKPGHEMTGEELDVALARVKAELSRRERPADGEPHPEDAEDQLSGVFG